MLKKISLLTQVIFYFAAGVNHFINPLFYLPLIPPYLRFHAVINYGSGAVEIVLAILLTFKITRKIASYSIIVMLVLFIPSHVYFIQIGGCVGDGLCAPEWLGWVRLLLVHPLLILWAWSHRNVAN